MKHKEHSIKPYTKDLSEAHEAFYKSMKDYLILAWCTKENKNTKDANHVNKKKQDIPTIVQE